MRLADSRVHEFPCAKENCHRKRHASAASVITGEIVGLCARHYQELVRLGSYKPAPSE